MDARDAGIFLDIPIDRKSLAEVTEEALEAINRRISQRVFVCANPHSLVVAQHDLGFQSALTQANLVVADGVGVTVMAKLAGVQIGPRITGTDYFPGSAELPPATRWRARLLFWIIAASP